MKNPFLQRRTLALLISAGLRNRPVLHAGTRPSRSLSHVRAAAKVYLEGQDSSEMFDVYEPPLAEERGGLLTRVVRAGYSKARGKVHEDGDWHRAVHVWIVDPVARTLLLQLRSEHKDTFPNCWDVSVGGHIEAGDESLPTAIREIEEELGLTGVEGKLEHLGTVASSLRGSTRKHGSFHCQELQDIYLLPLPNLDTGAIKFAEGEISGLRAVPIERLKQEYEAEDPSYVPRPAHYRQVLFERLLGRTDA